MTPLLGGEKGTNWVWCNRNQNYYTPDDGMNATESDVLKNRSTPGHNTIYVSPERHGTIENRIWKEFQKI